MTAQISANYNRYGSRCGYLVFAVGFGTFIAKNIKMAKEWCEGKGFDYILA